MTVAGQQLQDLEAILRRAVVRIELLAGQRVVGSGTGFLVDTDQVLTCYHVVRPAVEGTHTLRVVAWDGSELPSQLAQHEGPGWPDLALLRVQADLPSVVLDESPVARDIQLLAAGFPEGSVVTYQTPGMIADGQSSDDMNRPFQKVREAQLVPGLSGGPVVEREGGFVCGVTRLTAGAQGPVGGFVIPVSTVLQVFPKLREVHDAPGPGARPWADALGADHLARFNREADGRRQGIVPARPRVDLLVQGADGPLLPRWWTVTVGFPHDSGVDPRDVRLTDLGDDLIEALDRWSRRRPLEGEDEVELLGRVLHRAILPTAVGDYVRGLAGGANGLLLRLHVRPGRLSEIPWEYARPEGGPPLATDPKVSFARYIDRDCPVPSPRDRLRLLLAVVCPPHIHSRLGFGREVAPDSSEIARTLEQLITDGTDGRVEVQVLVNPDVTRFKAQLKGVDVVHYIGYGRARLGTNDGELAFCNTAGKADWARPRMLAENLPARLAAIVVQLQVPPGDDRDAPLPSGSLLPLLEGATAAVIGNHYPAPLEHLTEFTSYLYSGLARGLAIEDAVQAARTHLRDQNPLGDSTAFGMFSVTTCRSSGHVLLQPSHSEPAQADVLLAPRFRAAGASDPGPWTPPVDELSRDGR